MFTKTPQRIKLTKETTIWKEDDFIYTLKLIDKPILQQILENQDIVDSILHAIEETKDETCYDCNTDISYFLTELIKKATGKDVIELINEV